MNEHNTEEKKAPIRRTLRLSELDSRSVKTEQKPDIRMPGLDEPVERESDIIMADASMKDKVFEDLAFAEEPVQILIHKSADRKNAQMVTDYIAVNGVAAEVLFKNGWIRQGYLPRGVVITVKRKVVEVLSRAKHDEITTTVVERDGEDPQNFVGFNTTQTTSFTVIKDVNPKGAEWLTGLLYAQV